MIGPPGRGQVAGGAPAAVDPAAAQRRRRRSRWRGSPAPAGGSAAASAAAGPSGRRITRSARPGVVGGGNPPGPGEATLAHRGVLFLDELCEFRRDTLEALRAPLEDGCGDDLAGRRNRRLPCRFMLVAASNPCPCGRGEADPECSCAPLEVRRYQGRLSGALADRIDILVAIRQPSAAEIGGAPGEASAAVRERVAEARERQEARLGARSLQRRDDAGGGARLRRSTRRRRRCSPRPTRAAGSAAAPTTGCCAWRRRSPTWRAPSRSGATRSPRHCN